MVEQHIKYQKTGFHHGRLQTVHKLLAKKVLLVLIHINAGDNTPGTLGYYIKVPNV